MPEGRRELLLGGISVVAGVVVIFCSWFFFVGIGCGDPWPGCHQVVFNWRLGLVGMILVVLGLGMFTHQAFTRMKTDQDHRPIFISAMALLVLFVLITVVAFNPLVSPYDFIRDSDGDGFTDDIDSFPHDKARHMPTYFDVELAWENTSSNYTARISNVYYYLNGGPTDTSIMRLDITWVPEHSISYNDTIGILADIDGKYADGVIYWDNAPLGLFGVNDTISFDKSVFDVAADAWIYDDMGNLMTSFHITV